MKWSQSFIPTLKEDPSGTEAMSHKLSLRAGLVHMLTSGVYSYLPLGMKVLTKIQDIIREEMNAAGAQEVFMPVLHPMEIWQKTGRDQTLKDVMIQFQDQKGRSMCLGPTHEEIITVLARDYVQSYRQMPVVLYQIQTKFRDELRPRFGIVRACEFIMKDAYSFDISKDAMQKNYDRMHQAYVNIFDRLDLNVVIIEADSGAMGGDVSHEFMVPAAIGEDTVTVKDESGASVEQVAMELGHIFQLGTKYSDALGAHFIDEKGKKQPMIMGCYGIGVSRVLAAIIETHYDEKGIIWPKRMAPFDVELIALSSGDDTQIREVSNQLYNELQNHNLDVLFDDRNETVGRKLNDADLIGIPIRIVVGQRNLKNNNVEVKQRHQKQSEVIAVDQVVADVLNIFKS